MSELDIRIRLPQDRRIKYLHNGVAYDFRVSTLPTVYGEKVVIRISTARTPTSRLQKSGISERNEQRFREMLRRPNGLDSQSAGPTGSGKSLDLICTL